MALPLNDRVRAVNLMRQSKLNHGVYKPKTVARKIETSESTVWRLWSCYDGTEASLKPKYGNQKKSKREITPEEHKVIVDVIADNPYIGWAQLHGQVALHFGYPYDRHPNTVTQYCKRNNLRPAVKIEPRHKPQPYHTAKQIGWKWQIDHKKVSFIDDKGNKRKSITKVQYSCTDEASGEEFICYFDGFGAEQTIIFFELCQVYYGYYPIITQMDNGVEFKNKAVHDFMTKHGIEWKHIKVKTPRWNGKIERKHGNHEMWFYRHNTNFENIAERIAHQNFLNNHATSRVLRDKDNRQISPIIMRGLRIADLDKTMAIIKARPKSLQEKIHRYWLYKRPYLKRHAWAKPYTNPKPIYLPTADQRIFTPKDTHEIPYNPCLFIVWYMPNPPPKFAMIGEWTTQ